MVHLHIFPKREGFNCQWLESICIWLKQDAETQDGSLKYGVYFVSSVCTTPSIALLNCSLDCEQLACEATYYYSLIWMHVHIFAVGRYEQQSKLPGLTEEEIRRSVLNPIHPAWGKLCQRMLWLTCTVVPRLCQDCAIVSHSVSNSS